MIAILLTHFGIRLPRRAGGGAQVL